MLDESSDLEVASIDSTPATKRPRRGLRVTIAVSLWILYWAALFVATHLPPEDVPTVPANDKSLHFIAFLGLALMTGVSVSLLTRLSFLQVLLLWGLLVTYAALDEITQKLVGRSAEFNDWIADSLGITAGLTVIWVAKMVLRIARPKGAPSLEAGAA